MPTLPELVQIIRVAVVGDDTANRKFKQEVDKTDDSLKDLKGSASAVQQQFDGMAKSADKAADSQKKLGAETQKTKKSTDDMAASQRAVQTALASQLPNWDKLARAKSDVDRANLSLQASELRVQQAQEKYTKAIRDGNSETDKARRARIDLDAANIGLARSQGRLSTAFAAHDREVRRGSDGTNAFSKSQNGLQRALQTSTGLFTRFVGALAVLKIPALVSGVIVLGQAIAAIGGAAVAVTSALGPLVGLLGALPGAALGLGVAFGTVKSALSGVGDAMKAQEGAEKTATANTKVAAKAAEAAAKAREAAAERVRDAQRSLTKTIESSALAVENAEKRVVDAHEAAADAAVDGAEAIRDANRSAKEAYDGVGEAAERAGEMNQRAVESVTRAEGNLTTAQNRARQTQLDLNRARLDAAEALQQLNFQARGAALSEEGAAISLIEAQENYREVMASRASDDLDRRRAALQLKQAELGVAEAKDRNADTQAKLNEEQRKGVEGSDQVQSAIQDQKDAIKDQQDAERELSEARVERAKTERDAIKVQVDAQQKYVLAIENVAKVQEDTRDRTIDAQEAIGEAEKDLARTRRDAADDVAEAQRNLTMAIKDQADAIRDAAADLAEAAGKTDKYKEAMAKLSPVQRAFVEQLLKTKEQMKELGKSAAAGLLPGLGQALRNLTPLFPALAVAMKDTGDALGGIAEKATRLISAPAFRRDLAAVMATNADAFRTLGGEIGPTGGVSTGLMGLLDSFRRIMVVAQPLVAWIAQLGNQFGAYVNKLVITNQANGDMALFFQKAMDVAKQVGGIFRTLGGIIYDIGRASSSTGRTFLQMFGDMLKRWREWTGSVEGQNRMKKFFEDTIPVISALGRLIGDVVKIMARFADPAGMAPLIDQLRTKLLPPIERILAIFADPAIQTMFIDLIQQLLIFVGELAGSGGVLTGFVGSLLEIMKAVNWMIENIPFAREFFFILTTGLGAKLALGATLFKPLSMLNQALGSSKGLIGGFANAVGFLPGTINKSGGPITKLGQWFGTIASNAGSAAVGLFKFKGAAKEVGEEVIDWGAGGAISGAAGKRAAGGAAGRVAGQAAGAAVGGAAAGAATKGGLMAGLAGTVGAIPVAGQIALAVAAVVAGLVILYKNWKPFRDLIDSTWQQLQQFWDWFTGALGDMGSQIAHWAQNVGGVWSDLWMNINDAAQTAWQTMQSIWDGITGAFVAAWHAMYAVWDTVGRPIFDVMSAVIGFAMDVVVGLFRDAFDIIQGLIGIFVDALLFLFVEPVVAAFNSIGPALDQLRQWWDNAFKAITGIVDIAWRAIQRGWDWVDQNVFRPIGAAVNWLEKEVFGPAFSGIETTVNVSFGGIQSAWNWFDTNVLGPIHTAIGFLSEQWSIVWGGIETAARGVWQRLTSAWDSTLGRVMTALRQSWEWLRDNTGRIWDGIVGGITGAFRGMAGAIAGAVGPVVRFFGTLAGFVANILQAVGFESTAKPFRNAAESLKSFGGGGGGAPGAAAGGKAPYSDVPMVEVGPGLVAAGARAIVGEGNAAYPEYVIPTDPKYRRRAMGLYAALGAELGAMAIGGKIPAGAKGLVGSVTGAVGSALGGVTDLAKGIVGGVINLGKLGWDGISKLGKNAWVTASGAIRRGAANAMEQVWPVLPIGGAALLSAPAASLNTGRAGVVAAIRGREEKAAAKMRAGGIVPRRVPGFVGGGVMLSLPGYQTGTAEAAIGGSRAATTVLISGIKVSVREAFEALSGALNDSISGLLDGVKILHADLQRMVAVLEPLNEPVVRSLNEQVAALIAKLAELTGTTNLKVDTLGTNLIANDTTNTGLLGTAIGEGAKYTVEEVTGGIGTLDSTVDSGLDTLGTGIGAGLGTLGGTVSQSGEDVVGGIVPPFQASFNGVPFEIDRLTGAPIRDSLGNLPAGIEPIIDETTSAVNALPTEAEIGGAVTGPLLPPLTGTDGKGGIPGIGADVGAQLPPELPPFVSDPVVEAVKAAEQAFREGPPKTLSDVLSEAQAVLKAEDEAGKTFQATTYKTLAEYNAAVESMIRFLRIERAAGRTGDKGGAGEVAPGALPPTRGTGTAAGAAVYNRATLLVGEGSNVYPEYVIPTDPKHRRRARGLFAQLAEDLGVTGMQAGGVAGGGGPLGSVLAAAGRQAPGLDLRASIMRMALTIRDAVEGLASVMRPGFRAVSASIGETHIDLGELEGAVNRVPQPIVDKLGLAVPEFGNVVNLGLGAVTTGLGTLDVNTGTKLDSLRGETIGKLGEVVGGLGTIDAKLGSTLAVRNVPDPTAPAAPAPAPAPAPAGVPAPTVNKANRDAVRAVQRKLNAAGARLTVDGIWGPKTQAAWVQFGHAAGYYARGGKVGAGFKTQGPEVVVGEGNQAFPEYVIPTDPKYRRRARSLFSQLAEQLRIPGFQGGGILDTVLDAAGREPSAGEVFDATMGLREVTREGYDAMTQVIGAALQAVLDMLDSIRIEIIRLGEEFVRITTALSEHLTAVVGEFRTALELKIDGLAGAIVGALGTLNTDLTGKLGEIIKLITPDPTLRSVPTGPTLTPAPEPAAPTPAPPPGKVGPENYPIWDGIEPYVNYLERIHGVGPAAAAPTGPPAVTVDKRNRDAVREVQRRLNAAGARLVVDGIWGPKTQAAWDTFARAAGYEAGGKVGDRVGGGGRTEGPQILVGEGNSAFPEYVIPTDPKYRRRAKGLIGQLAHELRIPGFQGGGVLSSVLAASGAPSYDPSAGDVFDATMGMREVLREAFDALSQVVGAALQAVSDGLSTVSIDIRALHGDLPTISPPIVEAITTLGTNLKLIIETGVQQIREGLTILDVRLIEKLDPITIWLRDIHTKVGDVVGGITALTTTLLGPPAPPPGPAPVPAAAVGEGSSGPWWEWDPLKETHAEFLGRMHEQEQGGAVAAPAPTGPPPVTVNKSDRNAVKAVQTRLNAAGANLVVDGIWGPKTQAAWDTYARKAGYAKGGKVGPASWAAKAMSIGAGLKTSGPQIVVGEGNRAYPEFVIPTDPRYRSRARSLYADLGRDLGVTFMQDGGVVGVRGASDAAEALTVRLSNATQEMILELRRQTRALEQLVEIGRNQEGRRGTVFEEGAIKVDAKVADVAPSISRKMQVLAAVGAFGGDVK